MRDTNAIKRQAAERRKNYLANKEYYDAAGEQLVKKAEESEKKKRLDREKDTEGFCKDLASGLVGLAHERAWSFSGYGPGKKLGCCVCGGRPGTYHYKDDGRWYGSCCVSLYGASEEEVNEERKRKCLKTSQKAK